MTEGGREPCTELIEALLENSESIPVPDRVAVGDASEIQARLELLGRTLWDVFSNNHTVLDSEGNACDLGSFRGSARFIAEAINRCRPELGRRYDYIDFYMGAALMTDGKRLRPVYRWIFERLADRGFDWRYTFPQIYIFGLPDGADAGQCQDPEDFLSYDPSDALRDETEREERARDFRAIREEFRRQNEEAVRRARREPLPPVVAAYRDVYGRLPEGWPHPDM